MAIPIPQLVTVSGDISDQRLDIDNTTWQLTTITNEAVTLYGITSQAGTAYEIGYLKERPAALNFYSSNPGPAVAGETEVTTLGAIASTKFYVDYDRAFILFPDGHSTPVNVSYRGMGSIQKAKDINSAIGIAEKYQVSNFSPAPSTNGTGNAIAEGDLAYDSTANQLKVYNGSAWEIAALNSVTVTNIAVGEAISMSIALG